MLIWIGCVPLLGTSQQSPVARSASTSESVLRQWITKSVRPTYPAQDMKAGVRGVVVAQVVVTPDGKVDDVEILDAPSKAMGKAVENAVTHWEFAPKVSEPLRLRAKLTFYFTLTRGKAAVLYPSEAPILKQTN
jgi:TonB family protein